MPELRELRFDLPPHCEDVTEYFFESKPGPILKLPLSVLPLAPKDVDAWLLKAKDDLKVFPKARRGELETFENPKYLVRGFRTDFASASVVCALGVLEKTVLLLQPKCRPETDTEVRYAFRTLERDVDLALPPEPGVHRYRALGFRFDSLQPFEEPPYLVLEGPNRLSITGTASKRRIKPIRPDWSPDFSLSVGTILTETLQGRALVTGQSTATHPEPPTFRARYWFATAETEGKLRNLVYGDATNRTGNDHFRFELRGTGPSLEQLELWLAFLSGARRI